MEVIAEFHSTQAQLQALRQFIRRRRVIPPSRDLLDFLLLHRFQNVMDLNVLVYHSHLSQDLQAINVATRVVSVYHYRVSPIFQHQAT